MGSGSHSSVVDVHVGCRGHIATRACNSPDTCVQDTDSLHERKRTILIQNTHIHSNINTYPAAHSHVARCMVANSPSLASNRYRFHRWYHLAMHMPYLRMSLINIQLVHSGRLPMKSVEGSMT